MAILNPYFKLQGLGTSDSPTFATADLINITDGNIPYMSASGFADSSLYDDGSGNIGIGTTNPGSKLEVNGNISIKAANFNTEVDNGNSGATDTIDWTAGNKQKSTLTNNCTFTFNPEPSGPCGLTLVLVQDGTGSRTVTWPADVKWPGGTAPTLSTAAAAVDIITFYYDGTGFYGQSALDFS